MAGEGGKLLKKFSSFPRAPILFSKLFNGDGAIPGALREVSSGVLCRTFSWRARRAKCRASAAVRVCEGRVEKRGFFCVRDGRRGPGPADAACVTRLPVRARQAGDAFSAGRCTCRRQGADRRERTDSGKGRATKRQVGRRAQRRGRAGRQSRELCFFCAAVTTGQRTSHRLEARHHVLSVRKS